MIHQEVYILLNSFSKAISSDGEEDISSQSVKSKIKDLINNETVKTLSDTKLKNLLSADGIKIARRTITKYREEMNIPSSFERKKIKKAKNLNVKIECIKYLCLYNCMYHSNKICSLRRG